MGRPPGPQAGQGLAQKGRRSPQSSQGEQQLKKPWSFGRIGGCKTLTSCSPKTAAGPECGCRPTHSAWGRGSASPVAGLLPQGRGPEPAHAGFAAQCLGGPPPYSIRSISRPADDALNLSCRSWPGYFGTAGKTMATSSRSSPVPGQAQHFFGRFRLFLSAFAWFLL